MLNPLGPSPAFRPPAAPLSHHHRVQERLLMFEQQPLIYKRPTRSPGQKRNLRLAQPDCLLRGVKPGTHRGRRSPPAFPKLSWEKANHGIGGGDPRGERRLNRRGKAKQREEKENKGSNDKLMQIKVDLDQQHHDGFTSLSLLCLPEKRLLRLCLARH